MHNQFIRFLVENAFLMRYQDEDFSVVRMSNADLEQ